MREVTDVGKKILVVDDEREIADVIELYLKNDQYEVLKFYTGEGALFTPLGSNLEYIHFTETN